MKLFSGKAQEMTSVPTVFAPGGAIRHQGSGTFDRISLFFYDCLQNAAADAVREQQGNEGGICQYRTLLSTINKALLIHRFQAFISRK